MRRLLAFAMAGSTLVALPNGSTAQTGLPPLSPQVRQAYEPASPVARPQPSAAEARDRSPGVTPEAPSALATAGYNDPAVSPYYGMPSYPRYAVGGYGYPAPPTHYYPPGYGYPVAPPYSYAPGYGYPAQANQPYPNPPTGPGPTGPPPAPGPKEPAARPDQPPPNLGALLGLSPRPAKEAAAAPGASPGQTETYAPSLDDPSRATAPPTGAGRGGWLAGGGFYYLKPTAARNPAFTTTTATQTPGVQMTAQTTTDERQFHRGVQIAPLVWLGYRTEGNFGVRVRYWHFDQDTSRQTANGDVQGATTVASDGAAPFQVTSPGTALQAGVGADALRFTSRLELNVWDLEATQGFGAGDWTLVAGGGARVGTLRQRYAADRTNPGGTNGPATFTTDQDTLQWNSSFSGGGPLAVLEVYRPLAGGLGMFGTARGSVLFGQRSQHQTATATLNQVLNGGVLNTFAQQNANTSEDKVVSVGELELGLSYAREVNGCLVFVRSAVVGQAWQDVGSAVSRTGDLGFVGGVLELGLLY